jgi:hypothetical protein
MRALGGIAALALAACSSTGLGVGDAPPSLASGSRLRAAWLVTPDGVKLADGWFDSQLATRCHYRRSGDGALRCLPDAAAVPTMARFADAACSEPAIELPPPACVTGALVPEWIEDASTDACGAAGAFHRVTQQLAPNAAGWVRDPNSGVCAASSPFQNGYVYGDPLPAAQFVAAHEEHPAVGSARLVPWFHVGEDGSRELSGVFDSERGQRCAPELADDGVLRCLLQPHQVPVAYLDAQCTQPLVISETCDPEPPITVFDLTATTSGCMISPQLAIGDAVVPTTLYGRGAGGCAPIGPPNAALIYLRTGASIATSGLATVSEVTIGSGRIVEHALRGDGPVVMRGHSYRDTQLGADVMPGALTATSQALTPVDAAVIDVFADASCSQPLAESLVGCGRTSFLERRDGLDPAGCQLVSWFELGAEQQQPQRFFGTPANCVALTTSNPLYALGAPFDPSRFVPLTATHD